MNTISPDPIISVHRNKAVTSSRDVAAYFGKPHANVTRAILGLLKEGGVLTFEETPYTDPQNGQVYLEHLMDRDAFTVLAMGFTGKKALKFKLAYIAEFNRMQSTLENRSIRGEFDPSDSEMVLRVAAVQAAKAIAEGKRADAAEQRVAVLAPRAAALDELAASAGSQNITETAKALAVQPKKLFGYLESHDWIFRRQMADGNLGPFLPRADMVQRGLLEKSITTRLNRYGVSVLDTQTRVTAAGLTHLATLFEKDGKPE